MNFNVNNAGMVEFGRHKGFKIPRRKAYRFESDYPYQKNDE